jgi:hypothetical protein
MLPLLNSGKVELLDHPRLVSQLYGLERRTGKRSISEFFNSIGPKQTVSFRGGGH